ncbi:MAG: ABC transporter permease [Candidatus Aenigmarchaeota archaeon]|nr:ABC transporter permease [Candidatus Aenigmarchaeota archaeon]
MGTIDTIWLREMKRFVRARSRIVGNLSMPFVWLVIMGFGLSSSFTLPGVPFSYLEFFAPGIIGMTLLFTSIFAGISVIWEKQFGFLKEILVAPASRTAIAVGKMAGSVTVAMINGLLLFAIALLMGALPLAGLSAAGVAAALVCMALISAFFVSVGLILASRLDNMEGFQMIMSFLVMPTFFLSGAFFPLATAPGWMQALAFVNPLRYGVDGLRGSLLGVAELPLVVDLAVLAGAAVAATLVAGYAFRKIRL